MHAQHNLKESNLKFLYSVTEMSNIQEVFITYPYYIIHIYCNIFPSLTCTLLRLTTIALHFPIPCPLMNYEFYTIKMKTVSHCSIFS